MSTLEIIWRYREAFLGGMGVTASLSLIVWTSGIVFGAALGLTAHRFPAAGRGFRVAGAFVTGIPILVLLFWFHYPAQFLLNIVVEPFFTAAAALSLVNVFGVAGIVYAARRDFPEHFLMVAKVCGLSDSVTFRRIIAPMLVRQVLPGVLLLQVAMLHATLFASLISVDELFRVAQRVNAEIYRPVAIYSGLALFFLTLSLPLMLAASWLETRFQVLTSDR